MPSKTSQTTAKDVKAYLAKVPDEARATLEKLRRTIRSVVPDATEHISYRMPVFKLSARSLVWLAAFKDHCSLYPFPEGVRRSLGKELDRYDNAKGTLRFPHDKPPPATLVRKIVKARIAEEQARR